MTNELLVKRLNKEAVLPSKREEDSGYDISVIIPEEYDIVYPGERRLYPTGFCTAFPQGYGFVVANRGSVGSRGMVYGAHIIDSGYRGEVFVNVYNISNVPIIITDLPALEVRNSVIDGLNKDLTKDKPISDYRSIFNRIELLKSLDACSVSGYFKDNNTPLFHILKKSNPIVQALILPTMHFPVREVSTLPTSVRGDGKLGSTNTN